MADGQGKWSVDKMTGKITFTPLATFKGCAPLLLVNYYVVDFNAMQSATASISISYASVAAKNPVAANITLDDQVPGKLSIDILNGKNANGTAYVTAGSGSLKGNGVFLVAAEGIAQKLPVTGEGEWLVDMQTVGASASPRKPVSSIRQPQCAGWSAMISRRRLLQTKPASRAV